MLVIALDDGLRGILREVLSLGGYDVLDDATTVEAGMAYLDTYPNDMLVLVSNVGADHHLTAQFFAHVVADARLAAQYQYLLLSTAPDWLPPGLAAHLTQLRAEVCPKPFDMDTLFACISRAAIRLAAGQPARPQAEGDRLQRKRLHRRALTHDAGWRVRPEK